MGVIASEHRQLERSTPPRSVRGEAGPSPGASVGTVLAPLAQRALVMLPAQGAAIALCEGETFVCRAAAGALAPDVGVSVEVSAGLTGECVRTGQLIVCRDTAQDLRVDASVARSGIRGVLIAPVIRQGSVLGVIEAFSPTPVAFTPADQRTLAAIASQIVDLLPPAYPGWYLTPAIAAPQSTSQAAPAVPGFLDALSVERPPRSRRRLWIGGAVLATVAAATAITYTRERESFVAPAPVSESSVVNRQHLEAIKASAEQGNVGAQSILALFYWTGRGVKQDNEAAYMWSAIAAENGDSNSKERLQLLRAQMSPESVTRAEATKVKWLREHADAPAR